MVVDLEADMADSEESTMMIVREMRVRKERTGLQGKTMVKEDIRDLIEVKIDITEKIMKIREMVKIRKVRKDPTEGIMEREGSQEEEVVSRMQLSLETTKRILMMTLKSLEKSITNTEEATMRKAEVASEVEEAEEDSGVVEVVEDTNMNTRMVSLAQEDSMMTDMTEGRLLMNRQRKIIKHKNLQM